MTQILHLLSYHLIIIQIVILHPFVRERPYIYIYIYIYDHIHDHILQKDSENFEEVVKVRQMIVTKSRKEKQKSTLAYTVWLSL